MPDPINPFDPDQPPEHDHAEDEFWSEFAEEVGDPLPGDLPTGVKD